MNALVTYSGAIRQILDRIVETQSGRIEEAAGIVAEVVARDGIVYAFGSGHSSLIATEFYQRAGGLVCFDVIHDRTFGRAEHLDGYARMLLEDYPISSRDALIIASNSGRNVVPVEMAHEARRRGITTIAITSLSHSQRVTSRHPSGQRLYEICDTVIDSCTPFGDAVIELADMRGTPVGATSTVAGVFIVNCIGALAVSKCLARGLQPGVFVSANVDDGSLRNRGLSEFVRARTKGI